MTLKNEIEKTMFKEGIEDRIQDIATFMDISVEIVKKRLKTLSFSDYIKVMNSLKTQDKDNIERIMGMPARDPNWKSPIDDIDDEEEQHRRDVKHGLYGDDEEEDESEDDKEQHRRDVKHGLYGDDVDEGAEMHISPDIARAKTLQHTLPSLDREKYEPRDGLEGPIMTKSGKVVYYDPIEGSYYDPDTDIYLTYEEWKELSEAYSVGSQGPDEEGADAYVDTEEEPVGATTPMDASTLGKVKAARIQAMQRLGRDNLGGATAAQAADAMDKAEQGKPLTPIQRQAIAYQAANLDALAGSPDTRIQFRNLLNRLRKAQQKAQQEQ